jgi:FtsH-binding integral membrane protein
MDRSKVFSRTSVDVGLRQFMLGTYNYMGLGLALTGAVVFLINSAPLGIKQFFFGIQLITLIATIGVVLYFSRALVRMSALRAQGLFWVYAALQGITIAGFVGSYSVPAVTQAFFVTALTFGGASLYGHLTKRDLSSMGSLFMMGLIGLLVAGLVNLFLRSSAMGFAISAISVLLFTGLTAYDTQRIRSIYFQLPYDQETREKFAVLGALSLYMDVLQIFLSLLRLSDSRD